MQKREKIMAAITLVAALIFVVNQFFLSDTAPEPQKVTRQTKPKPAAKSAPVRGEKISNTQLQDRLQNWQPLVEYDTWGRDPFSGSERLAMQGMAQDSTLTYLTGIVWKNEQAFAIIGDKILRKGESTDDLKIVQIYKDKVLAQKGQKLITLQLGDDARNKENEKESVTNF